MVFVCVCAVLCVTLVCVCVSVRAHVLCVLVRECCAETCQPRQLDTE